MRLTGSSSSGMIQSADLGTRNGLSTSLHKPRIWWDGHRVTTVDVPIQDAPFKKGEHRRLQESPVHTRACVGISLVRTQSPE